MKGMEGKEDEEAREMMEGINQLMVMVAIRIKS
jgi:hypothetical protein